MLKNVLEILPYPEIPRVHKCCGSIFFGGVAGGGGGEGGGGVKFINFTLFRYQTDSLWGHEVRQTDSLIMIHHHNLKQRENY